MCTGNAIMSAAIAPHWLITTDYSGVILTPNYSVILLMREVSC